MAKKLDPLKVIVIHAIVGDEVLNGWVHTHGMVAHHKPELELFIRPVFMIPLVFDFVNDVAEYILNSPKEVKAGDTMQMGNHRFKLVAANPLPDQEAHYDYDVLRLEDIGYPCDHPTHGTVH
jgi:hypothetical protein